MSVWVIDLCEDNLLRVEGAKEAAAELEHRLEQLFSGQDIASYRVYRQSCIKACRPCHQSGLIARVNNQLICGENNASAIENIISCIKI